MAGAVDDHLGHGALAVTAFATRFVIDGLGQAFEIAAGVQCTAKAERLGRRMRRVGRGKAQARRHVRPGGTQLLQTRGQQLGLAVATAGSGDGIGIVAAGDGQRTGVEAPGGGRERFFGKAGRGRAVQTDRLGAQGRGLGHRTAQIGHADRQTEQTAHERRGNTGRQSCTGSRGVGRSRRQGR